MDEPQGLSTQEWHSKLAEIGEHLQDANKTAEFCVIGGVACMLQGQEGRTSMDCDVWLPRSKFNPKAVEEAALKAGIDFNPMDADPSRPYIQVITPGIVQVGKFDEAQDLAKSGGLTITAPPTENLIASKLRRADAKDLSDIAFLLSRNTGVSRADVEGAIQTMPSAQRAETKEALVYLDVLASEKSLSGHESAYISGNAPTQSDRAKPR